MSQTVAHPRNTALLIGLLCAGVFLTALDQTIVVTALPSMMLDLQIQVRDLDQASWIVTGYLLGYTVALPLLGRVADAYGYARIFLLAMLVFIAASVAIPLMPSLPSLVAARVVQALGGGAIVPIAFSLATFTVPWQRRALVLGLVAAMAEAGAVLGPLYGGLIVEHLSWRWIFWLNIPLGLLIALPVFLQTPRASRPGVRVDYAGGLVLGLTIAGLLLALRLNGETLVLDAETLAWGGATLAALGALILWERRARDPLVPAALLRWRPFLAAGSTHFLVGAALIVALVNVPLMANTIMGQSPLEGGLRLLRLTVFIPPGALLGGLLARRAGYRLPAILGLLAAAGGFSLLMGWQIDVAEPELTLHLALTGLGFGLVIPPLATAMLDSAREEERGIAASLFVLTRMLGMMVGLAAITAWGISSFRSTVAGLPLPLPLPGETAAELEQRLLQYQSQLNQAILGIFRHMFLAGLALCLAALLPTFWLGRPRDQG
ncbi:MAG: MFS transporter [Dehalococcoidia bacterium]